ncbi:type VI secretion system protein TssL, long form [uncultured Alsobacter sp.]|uniref:type VI secretion system protein TssL, long form n=1 Tax=uncultured Alsobacter sp. TaxID=1748258 RepID=UPI0025E40A02|nr:type VI secretion system protein TssL, long form [uncultured Alsobacter sp.]
MTSGDNPFGPGSGERTVFMPNPGGRRPPTPPPPAPAPGAAPPLPPGVNSQDDWIVTQRAQQQDPSAHLQRAEDLRFDELAADHENPIMRSAGPLLLLLGRLRVAMVRASFASLMEQVAAAISFFDKEIRAAGVSPERANTAKYILCATADDIVQNIPTSDRHVWTQYSMLSRFYGELLGGVRFFEELDRLRQDPVQNYDVLELQHACLALGFQGVHRSSPNGMSQLQTLQRSVYELLRRVKPKVQADLSPRWRGQALGQRVRSATVPVWSVGALAALLLVGGFLGLRTLLTGASEASAADVIGLHPSTPIELRRPRPAPPPPKKELTEPQLTQLQRIRAGLAPEIKDGTVTVDPLAKWIAVRVGNLILFESGKADVVPEFKPLGQRIVQILEKEVGPVRIVGHTDNQPLSALNRFKDNQQLSLERAKGVAALIQPNLKDPSRVSLDGRGPDEPIGDNKTNEGRAKNRRVEILIWRTD